MPNPPLPVYFLLLHEENPQNYLHNAPWKFPSFRELLQDIPDEQYPSKGLWPPDDRDLPRGLTREESNNLRAFYKQAKPVQNVANLCKLKAGEGREVMVRFFGRLFQKARLLEQLEQYVLNLGMNPVVLQLDDGEYRIQRIGPLLHAPVGQFLFGRSCLFDPDSSIKMVRPAFIQVLNNTLYHTFRRLKYKTKSFLSSWPELMEDLTNVYQDLGDISKSPTVEQKAIWKDKVKLAIKLTSKVVRHSHLVPCKDWVKTAEDKMGVLNELMKELRAPLIREAKGGDKGVRSMERLCTSEEVDEFLTVYEDTFLEVEYSDSDNCTGGSRHHCCPQGVDEILRKGLDEESQSTGMGVTTFSALSDRQLHQILGIIDDGHVRGWHYHVHDYGKICRNSGKLCKNRSQFNPTGDSFPYFPGPSPTGYSPCQLRWEQLVAVASILHKLCTPEKNEERRGILLADEVGVGKTGTILGLLALYMELVHHSGKDLNLSPVFDEMKSFGARLREEDPPVPDKPILIISPVTLIGQWESEIHRFFPPGSVDVFVYTGGFKNHSNFFTSGKYVLSKHSPHRRIIIASQPAIAKDGQNILRPSSGGHLGEPRDIEKNDVSLGCALAQEYSIIAVDEAHNMRTRNALYTAVLALRPRCNAMILATATPLFTQASDLINLQRVAGIGGIGYELDDFEKEAKREMTRMKRSLKSGDADVSELTEMQIAQVSQIRKRYGDRLIRRTHSSLRYDGTPLSDLPPFEVKAFYIQLSEAEKEVLQTLTKEGFDENQGKIKFTGRNFYLDYRKAIGHKDWGTGGSPRLPRSLVEWEANKGTKLDVISQLCQHLLSDDNAPHPVPDEQGFFMLPAYEPPLNADKKRKILIYQEFRGLAALLQMVLRLRGVDALTLGGNDSPQKRQETVQKFKEEGSPARVLIFSKVGNAGLNLACADTVIFADQPWSAQEEQQIIGRAWRSPQKQTVRVYYLLAKDTTDVMMAGMAVQKSKMLGGFFQENLQSPLVQFLHGDNPEWEPTTEQLEIVAGSGRYADETEDDEIEEFETEDAIQVRKERKRKKPLNPRGSKTVKKLSADEMEDNDSAVVAQPRKRQKKTQAGEDKAKSLSKPEIQRFKEKSPMITEKSKPVETLAKHTSQVFIQPPPSPTKGDPLPLSDEPLTPPTCAQPSSRMDLSSPKSNYPFMDRDELEGASDSKENEIIPTSDPREVEEWDYAGIGSNSVPQNLSLRTELPPPPSTSSSQVPINRKGKAPAEGPWRPPPTSTPSADKQSSFAEMLNDSMAIMEKGRVKQSTVGRRRKANAPGSSDRNKRRKDESL